MSATIAMFDTQEPSRTATVVPIRAQFLPRHQESLMQWLTAGQPMGLCDVDVSRRGPQAKARRGRKAAAGRVAEAPVEHILVWVRENADPAYLIRPDGMRWTVIDHLRQNELGRFACFEAALNAIRPVLPQRGAVVAA